LNFHYIQSILFPELSDDENGTEFDVQKVHNGVLVDNEVYLTDSQWNTIMDVALDLHQCFVCDVVIDGRANEHIQTENHIRLLDQYKPIIIDPSRIIRRVGVCLVCYPGQNNRIAPLSFLHGCRKRRLKNSTYT
jgi:hypothetical protein